MPVRVKMTGGASRLDVVVVAAEAGSRKRRSAEGVEVKMRGRGRGGASGLDVVVVVAAGGEEATGSAEGGEARGRGGAWRSDMLGCVGGWSGEEERGGRCGENGMGWGFLGLEDSDSGGNGGGKDDQRQETAGRDEGDARGGEYVVERSDCRRKRGGKDNRMWRSFCTWLVLTGWMVGWVLLFNKKLHDNSRRKICESVTIEPQSGKE